MTDNDMTDTDMTDQSQPDTERAAKLSDRSEDHQGNRVSADPDAPQPTREPTRDQDK